MSLYRQIEMVFGSVITASLLSLMVTSTVTAT